MNSGPLASTYGSARRPGRSPAHPRPEGLSEATVAGLGKLSEALEVVEHARGLLYGFHRMSGTADRTLQEAVTQIRAAGHEALADELAEVLVGRDVIDGKWSFELVEAYDRDYWSVFREVERYARVRIGELAPHILESEMKHREQHSG